DSWRTINTINSPNTEGSTIWTGNEMIVWGGSSDNFPYFLDTGRRYNADADIWIPTSMSGNAPVGRFRNTAVWTGSEMIIWGGDSNGMILDNGGRYCASITTVPPASNQYDFNGDGKPDYVLYASTHQTGIWYLNDNVYVNGASGPTLAAGSVLI